jgi:hypothetical protein
VDTIHTVGALASLALLLMSLARMLLLLLHTLSIVLKLHIGDEV